MLDNESVVLRNINESGKFRISTFDDDEIVINENITVEKKTIVKILDSYIGKKLPNKMYRYMVSVFFT